MGGKTIAENLDRPVALVQHHFPGGRPGRPLFPFALWGICYRGLSRRRLRSLLPAPLECVRIPRVRYLPIAEEDAYFSLSVAVRQSGCDPAVRGFLELLDEVGAARGGEGLIL